jgi:hypothetical protein
MAPVVLLATVRAGLLSFADRLYAVRDNPQIYDSSRSVGFGFPLTVNGISVAFHLLISLIADFRNARIFF